MDAQSEERLMLTGDGYTESTFKRMSNSDGRSELSVLDKVRRWIDGESNELVLEEAARKAQVEPRSKAEEFIVKIARDVEAVMQSEMVPLPQGTTIIPTEYIIFLSDDDDKEWQGVKRRGLEQGLYHILAERAQEIAGKKKLETRSFAVELRVDGTLAEGEVRVQHSWDESSSNKTGVLPRLKQQPEPAPAPPETPDFVNSGANLSGSIPATSAPGEREEMTQVKQRGSALYRLEVWRGDVRQDVIPVYDYEIVIGRGSKSRPVDIVLSGDPEISRRHLVLILSPDGQFFVVNEGRNPAVLKSTELPIGRRVEVAAGEPIHVCSYLLRAVR